MYIERLLIQDFGKYHQQEFKLNKGINLIYGANEAGKTTIQAFILGMLFGLEGMSETEAVDWVRHWKPRNAESFGGVMEWIQNGNRYCLQRNFNTGESVLEIKTGNHTQTITELAGVQEELKGLLELSAEEYRNTLCISGEGAEYSENLYQSIRERCAMQEEGSSNTSLKPAYQYLQQQREQLNRSGVEHAIQALERKQKDLKLEERLRELTQQREKLEQELLEISGEAKQEQIKEDKEEAPQGKWKWLLEKGQSDPQMRLIINMIKLLLAFGVCALIFVLIFILPVSLYYKGWLTVIVVAVAIYGGIRYTISKKHSKKAKASGIKNGTGTGIDTGTDTRKPEASARILECSHQLAELQVQENELLKENSRQQEYRMQHQELIKQLSDIEEALQAIDLAETTIRNLAEQENDAYATHMSQKISEVLAKITRGHCVSVKLDAKLRIQVETTEGEWDVKYLSTGTQEQIWLAVRLAVAEELQTKHLPLILDDMFGTYDVQRLRMVMEYLSRYAAEQLIIFASDDRVADCLDQNNENYHYIEL